MKYLPLIWAGIWRKRRRAVLMMLQIASAFLLFGVLQGLDAGVDRAIAQAHRDRLYVGSRIAFGNPLPLALLARIRSIAGVEYVVERVDFGGTYRHANQYIPAIAVNAAEFFRMYTEAKVSPGAARALERDRAGAVVGRVTMRKYGWHIGEHVVIDSPIAQAGGSHAWGFDIVGTYSVHGRPTDSVLIICNFDYLNERRRAHRDRVSFYVAKIARLRPRAAGAISLAIDNAFANSANPTHTRSGAELAAAQTQQLGDIDLAAHSVLGAVFFALLLATGALMMQSLRERTGELAVMKTIGFTGRRVFAILLAESVVLCVAAAAVGLAGGAALLPFARREIGLALVPGAVFAEGIGCAVLLGLVSAAAPARRGARLSVAEALSGR